MNNKTNTVMSPNRFKDLNPNLRWVCLLEQNQNVHPNNSRIEIKYRKISHECKLEITKFDTMRQEKLLETNNLGAFYKFVNKKMGNHSCIAPLKTADD